MDFTDVMLYEEITHYKLFSLIYDTIKKSILRTKLSSQFQHSCD